MHLAFDGGSLDLAEVHMSKETLKAPRYEIKTVWHEGKKRFAVHDLQRNDEVVGTFDSARDASIQTTLL
jgi:hypothetical protein